MNEARAPTNEEIKKQIKADYLSGIKPKELSDKSGVPVNTIKSWIKRGKWNSIEAVEDAPLKKEGAPSKQKRGAPSGNKNAEEAGAPPGNKNALKHGGYSAVYWDVLDDEEMGMIEELPQDEETLLLQQIQLFSVRERRIMQAINKYRSTKEPVAISYTSRSESKRAFKDTDEEKEYNRRQQEKIDKEEILPGRMYSTTTGTENKDNIIARLESELSNVQAKKTKAIDTLAKLHIEKQKMDGGSKGNEIVRTWAEKILQARREQDGQ